MVIRSNPIIRKLSSLYPATFWPLILLQDYFVYRFLSILLVDTLLCWKVLVFLLLHRIFCNQVTKHISLSLFLITIFLAVSLPKTILSLSIFTAPSRFNPWTHQLLSVIIRILNLPFRVFGFIFVHQHR